MIPNTEKELQATEKDIQGVLAEESNIVEEVCFILIVCCMKLRKHGSHALFII